MGGPFYQEKSILLLEVGYLPDGYQSGTLGGLGEGARGGSLLSADLFRILSHLSSVQHSVLGAGPWFLLSREMQVYLTSKIQAMGHTLAARESGKAASWTVQHLQPEAVPTFHDS